LLVKDRSLKILWVKAGGIYPPNIGGRIRSFHLLKVLARRHSVTLFTFYAATDDDQHSEFEHDLARIVCMPLMIPTGRTLGEAVRYGLYMFSPLPYTVSKFCQPKVTKRLHQLVLEVDPDVIVCDFVVAAQVIPWAARPPKILFTHNVETEIWKRHYELTRNPLWKAIYWREYRAMRHFERKFIDRADHVLTVSDHDRKIFAKMIDPSRITVIPTGVDVDFFRVSDEQEEPDSIVFCGAMDWKPNEDGVVFFINEVLPRIRRNIRGASLRVVGRQPSRQLLELGASQRGIEITGRVDDIRPFVQRAAVYVVPLRIGGGTRLKIFEAMAMGKAVVSTTIGAEGLPVRSGHDLMIADKPEDFANITVALLRDPDRRAQIGRTARALVEQGYSWESVAKPFESVLKAITST
jgi:sugar transferase (PEP-CTERM/EpsH1 system associated)